MGDVVVRDHIGAPSEPLPAAAEIARFIGETSGLDRAPIAERREILEALVRHYWGELPCYSTLEAPEILPVATATVGAGMVPIFLHPAAHEWYAVVERAGSHYRGPHYVPDESPPTYMAAGGFINLSRTDPIEGYVAGDRTRGEHPRVGALREWTEEVVDDKGHPVLLLSPDRLDPRDTLLLAFPSGERRLVIGFSVTLDPAETDTILAHIDRLDHDADFRRACRAQTKNPVSQRPEVCRVDALPLRELAQGSHTLLYHDQGRLFDLILRSVSAPRPDFGDWAI